MTDPIFDSLTIRRDTAGAVEDLLTLDSVSGTDGNGSALSFINNSATPGLYLALGRLSASRVDSATVRLELAVARDPTVSSGDDTPPLLSLVSGAGGLSVATPAGSTLDVGGALSVTGLATLNGGVRVAGNLDVTGTVDGRDVSADGTRLDQHLARTDNPHATTAAQVGALPTSGGNISGNLTVAGTLNVAGAIKGDLRMRVASATVPVSVILQSAAVNAVSVTIATDTGGSVLLTGSSKVKVEHTAGRQSLAWIGVPNGNSGNSTFVQIPTSAPTGEYYIPFSITRVVQVSSAGTYTYSMTALKPPGFDVGGGDRLMILEPNLTALFVPGR